MSRELPKAYEPGQIEPRWADQWLEEKLYSVTTPEKGEPGSVFTILLPPPNVTGHLHMGHMLEHTQTDILVRWQRMRGRKALWVPGTDHAGIATQMLVERQLASEGIDRRKLGREEFVRRVWEWREHYGGVILKQMRRLGASVDWEREYFTMDEARSRAVREVFVRLHEQGLIYRGRYIVNWCPRCLTALSDLEVVHEEFAGKLYEIRYPVTGTEESITVATTRPETMLGDTAVAVHPEDERYRHLHGKKVVLPLAPPTRKDVAGKETPREIPIILDELANPEFGTGAVKVTPAHDANDFQAGLRHNLPQVNVMDDSARMNQEAGRYAGLDRYQAREKMVEDLEAQGLLGAVKEHTYAIGKCDRCKTIVEPRLSTQWFVKIAPLAERAMAAVESGEITIVPENYTRIYFDWMRNIHDWCVSRQLWWGHRIPAWHCAECGETMVAREEPKECKCGSQKLVPDPDVLDTWFSSGLLPFTAFGWPEKTRDLDVFYPTTVMITGKDILFFWVARMIMFGCHFMQGHPAGSVPFRQVYIHALVRDPLRQKMSKTKGNVVDPIEITDRYGTDAVRFSLAMKAAPGTDITFSEKNVEGSQAFANKIWNAARFMFLNVDRAEQAGAWSLKEFQVRRLEEGSAGKQSRPELLEDRWIVSRFHRVAQQANEALADYRFHEASQRVYEFFWGDFCDWYIELVKLRLGGERAAAAPAFEHLVSLFEAALRLLAPFMPFISEELWHAIHDGKPPLKSVSLAPYPQADAALVDLKAETEMAILQDLIQSVRNLRAELKVEAKERTPIRIHAGDDVRGLVERNREAIEKLANAEGIRFTDESLADTPGARTTARFDVAVVYERKVDVAAERARLGKELERIQKELANATRQLANQRFLEKAPPQVVEGLRSRSRELEVLQEKTRGALGSLGDNPGS